MADSKTYDGLTKDQRYRLKDLDAYRKRKREYAQTPEQREHRKEYMRKWRKKNKDHYNKWAKEYHHKNKEKWISRQRGWRLKCVYDITEEQYKEMLLLQDGKCMICGKEHTDTSKGLHIDHDHSTGKIRGLLCSRCNGALGWYEKCKEKIESYLNKIIDEKRNSRTKCS